MDDSLVQEIDFNTLYEEFEEKMINNMKLLCFKIFLKDAPSYSKWSKSLDELKKENQSLTSNNELLGGSWQICTKKMN